MESTMMNDSKKQDDKVIVAMDKAEIELFQKEHTEYGRFLQLGESLKNAIPDMHELVELQKLGIDSLKNKTSNILLYNDREYQVRYQLQQKAYKEMMALKLPKEQMDVINTYIARRDEADFDRHTIYYMAGMLDNYEILKLFNLTNE